MLCSTRMVRLVSAFISPFGRPGLYRSMRFLDPLFVGILFDLARGVVLFGLHELVLFERCCGCHCLPPLHFASFPVRGLVSITGDHGIRSSNYAPSSSRWARTPILHIRSGTIPVFVAHGKAAPKCFNFWRKKRSSLGTRPSIPTSSLPWERTIRNIRRYNADHARSCLFSLLTSVTI